MLITLFRNAGATGHVFFLAGGKTVRKGVAYSGFVGPMTTVAVVPGTAQVIDFSVEARTKDKQSVTVTGNLKLVLVPEVVVSRFDFTVNTKTGSYLAAWQQALHTMVIEHVLAPIHSKARELTVETAISSHKDFEIAVKTVVTAANNPLVRMGITIESCSIAKVEANDEEVETAIGSLERQKMLTESDAALHNRRLKAADNERNVRTFEAETILKLEEERAKLLERQAEKKRPRLKRMPQQQRFVWHPLLMSMQANSSERPSSRWPRLDVSATSLSDLSCSQLWNGKGSSYEPSCHCDETHSA